MLKTAHGWGGVEQILGVNMIFHHFRNALVRICACSYIDYIDHMHVGFISLSVGEGRGLQEI